MPISEKIEYASLDQLRLDPTNPRLGRNETSRKLDQDEVLRLMRGWSLDVLATSFLESGFWVHEALIVIEEKLGRKNELVVIEGNRRLAALLMLRRAFDGQEDSKRWMDVISNCDRPDALFASIPYITVSSRDELNSFLGFRHVTGIKEWRPAEKAEYIAKLIEQDGMTYEEVMRKIGSTTPTVRQNYISYRLLLQIEDEEAIHTKKVEDKFSVLYLSLRTVGTQKFLNIDIKAEPTKAKQPVPKSKLQNLANFALWLFGDENTNPIVAESRRVDDFGKILESKKAIEYLETAERPNFETAFNYAGGDEPELVRLLNRAADNVELALGRVHLHKKSTELQAAVRRCGLDVRKLLRDFPDIETEVFEDE